MPGVAAAPVVLGAGSTAVYERGLATAGGPEAGGEAGEEHSERRFVEHGEDVHHEGEVSLHGGESDEEAVAGGGLRAVSSEARQKYEDEYPDSGEYSPGADKIYRKGYATDSDYQAREQSDHKFDDEYPDSGEYVPAPGGAASAKFMAWHLKSTADESMQGGEVPSGVVLE
ncbi:type II CRISPR RNA-guided endonuclease Cas9 [Chlorella sorokiniana]|uniref:Type II CRISPR RNA-guided endonuclease Cas9 n=1 Tax=Chlorella sorokiniana TaxID=3076 RepID=A0A2P6U318_CHLSO|nr:type II CRISPR RNA-guided endonuclease Cas9 [Chlorella sorokiniana]|eukprot:PRW60712.1 type II CRISPR RNA-guided endonuclease Cas9 [Chlorella sorokiniana]